MVEVVARREQEETPGQPIKYMQDKSITPTKCYQNIEQERVRERGEGRERKRGRTEARGEECHVGHYRLIP